MGGEAAGFETGGANVGRLHRSRWTELTEGQAIGWNWHRIRLSSPAEFPSPQNLLLTARGSAVFEIAERLDALVAKVSVD